ncbi:MAG: hypothetical protein HKN46_04005 [Acidimicrobiia bacterium]|nr:hypothetical protein [Acidimicrobiia bacterium]
MNGLDQMKEMWAGLDEDKQKALIGVMIGHALLVLLGFRNLSRTPDERIRGPRWLWKLLMPSSTIKVDDDNIVFAPTGVVAWFLIGKKWRKPVEAEVEVEE